MFFGILNLVRIPWYARRAPAEAGAAGGAPFQDKAQGELVLRGFLSADVFRSFLFDVRSYQEKRFSRSPPRRFAPRARFLPIGDGVLRSSSAD